MGDAFNLDLSGLTFVSWEDAFDTIHVIGDLSDETIFGSSQADLIEGGAGGDDIVGNGGSDTVAFTTASSGVIADLAVEANNTGDAAGDTYNLVENILGSAHGDDLRGDGTINILTGGGGNDTLDGRSGNDTVLGGAGDDTIRHSTAGVDTYDGGADTDTLLVTNVGFADGAVVDLEAGTWSFGATTLNWTNFENYDNSAGSALSDEDVFGTAGANVISTGAGDNTIDGRGGADTMAGGDGDDIYHVDNAGDIVVEIAGDGDDDMIFSSINYALSAAVEVESLFTSDIFSTVAINLTGNTGAQSIFGNAGANVLSDGGAGGEDVLFGFGGDDTYIVNNSNVIIGENSGQGTNDRVATSVNFTLAADVDIELFTTTSVGATKTLSLTGNALAQTILGNAGVNVLRSGTGANDVLRGLQGNDFYRVFNSGDEIIEIAGQGTDRVITVVDYALGAGDSIELFTTDSTAGTDDLNLTGNLLAQEIRGNAGDNILSDGGAGGNDTLRGNAGDDIYIVNNSGALIVESAGQGANDRVATSVNFALAADDNIELFTTTSSGSVKTLSLTGNALAQTILGNAGVNVLRSGTGADDVLRGLDGNDVYRVFNSGDQIIEVAGQGTDRVITVVDYALGAGDSIELFTTSSTSSATDLSLTGNALGQTIIGNIGDNRIDGGGGADLVNALGGADTFIFTSALGGGNLMTINGYSVTDDGIEIDNAIFTGLAGGLGTLATGNFRANVTGTAQDASDKILYDTDDGGLFYDADGFGAGARVQFAQINPGLAIANTEFEIV